jgi:hypothetical protein
VTKRNENVHVFEDQNYAVLVGNDDSVIPTAFAVDDEGGIVHPEGFFELGLIGPDGINEGHTYNENKIYDMAGALVRIARNQEERPFGFSALEENAVVAGLKYPGTTVSTTSTGEQQTITIVGTPTGGTFDATLPNFGAAIDIPHNISLLALEALLEEAFGVEVAVTGTPGASYVVDFGDAAADVPQMVVDGTGLTGGTTPHATVATGTPGVQGINTRHVGSGTGRNLRPFLILVADGDVHKMFVVYSGRGVRLTALTGQARRGGADPPCLPFPSAQIRSPKEARHGQGKRRDDQPADAASSRRRPRGQRRRARSRTRHRSTDRERRAGGHAANDVPRYRARGHEPREARPGLRGPHRHGEGRHCSAAVDHLRPSQHADHLRDA